MKVVIEHLEAGVSDWVKLEYREISNLVGSENFTLSSVPQETLDAFPEELEDIQRTTKDVRNIEGIDPAKVCLLDPKADVDLSPDDASQFEWLLFGGILGDDPPQDRTGELRKYGFAGRRLGDIQMTTDTAVRVTKLVLEGTPLDKIPYVTYPEIHINKRETVEMPFRYVADACGKPIMPKGMYDLIKEDSNKALTL
ncbi:hypothetical protein CANCADRAFT_147932 [Tortispora caseinolytica NRRL Y-17796]|uniref:DUF431-domain-containing protein n=1 Tax=Tortispora caseinolytica NRRL Y-17796 TaxID=767744 RepID=A0A1E4TEV0_9ASCO|nr:hypothetical protein CANCADRAFT_147932 [Tortispora caseinolytica NRRL Y-17796]